MSDERNPIAEVITEKLKERFLKENPFAQQAKQAYIDSPPNVPAEPMYYALMAIAFELFLAAESN